MYRAPLVLGLPSWSSPYRCAVQFMFRTLCTPLPESSSKDSFNSFGFRSQPWTDSEDTRCVHSVHCRQEHFASYSPFCRVPVSTTPGAVFFKSAAGFDSRPLASSEKPTPSNNTTHLISKASAPLHQRLQPSPSKVNCHVPQPLEFPGLFNSESRWSDGFSKDINGIQESVAPTVPVQIFSLNAPFPGLSCLFKEMMPRVTGLPRNLHLNARYVHELDSRLLLPFMDLFSISVTNMLSTTLNLLILTSVTYSERGLVRPLRGISTSALPLLRPPKLTAPSRVLPLLFLFSRAMLRLNLLLGWSLAFLNKILNFKLPFYSCLSCSTPFVNMIGVMRCKSLLQYRFVHFTSMML